jgi:raffinose/stachyose/melibiose transport system permease protein
VKQRRLPIFECLLLVAGLFFISPVFLVLINSFKTLPDINSVPLALPAKPTLAGYAAIFDRVQLARPMLNSLLMAAAVILCLITLAPMAAYSLVRRKMATGSALRSYFLAGLIVPFQVVMMPLLQEFRFLGIQYTYLSLLLVYVAFGLPLAIFIYSGFLSSIPRELEEAAAIDGCGTLGTFWRIIFPLLSPCTVTIVIFWGLWVWNDFLAAFVFMGSSRGQLGFVQLWRFLSDKYVKNWDTIFAGVVVLSLPVTILYLTMQRRLVKGLTAGAVK